MTDINNNNIPDEPDELDEPETDTCFMCQNDTPVDDLENWSVYQRHSVIYRRLCPSCYDNALTCAWCNEVTHVEDATWVDDADEYTCPDCTSAHTSFCRNHDIRYFDNSNCSGCEADSDYDDDDDDNVDHVHSYSYKPSPDFYFTIADKKRMPSLQTFTGFELEMEATDCERYEGSELAHNLFSSWTYLKNDGSLNNGFEMVSHPLGYDYAMNVFPWQKLSELSKLGMRSANTRTCGLHIHINRNIFDSSPSTMYRFMSMFYRNMEQWKRIAGRSDSTYASWSEYELQNMAHYAKRYSERAYNHERYVAINLQNRNTLELRFFKGTLRPETFIARIEAAHAVAHYAFATRNKVSIKSAHDWERFREWTIQNKYTMFDAYASSKGV